MPVLREDDVAELRAKPVDDRHDLIAARYGERAVRTKIVLHVDDDQNVAVADCVSCGQFCLRSFLSCVLILVRHILVRHGLAKRSAAADAAVDQRGELDQIGADFHRIVGVRLKPLQWFRQAFKIALGARADVVE